MALFVISVWKSSLFMIMFELMMWSVDPSLLDVLIKNLPSWLNNFVCIAYAKSFDKISRRGVKWYQLKLDSDSDDTKRPRWNICNIYYMFSTTLLSEKLRKVQVLSLAFSIENGITWELTDINLARAKRRFVFLLGFSVVLVVYNGSCCWTNVKKDDFFRKLASVLLSPPVCFLISVFHENVCYWTNRENLDWSVISRHCLSKNINLLFCLILNWVCYFTVIFCHFRNFLKTSLPKKGQNLNINFRDVAGRTKLVVNCLLLFSLANIAERRVRPYVCVIV